MIFIALSELGIVQWNNSSVFVIIKFEKKNECDWQFLNVFHQKWFPNNSIGINTKGNNTTTTEWMPAHYYMIVILNIVGSCCAHLLSTNKSRDFSKLCLAIFLFLVFLWTQFFYISFHITYCGLLQGKKNKINIIKNDWIYPFFNQICCISKNNVHLLHCFFSLQIP